MATPQLEWCPNCGNGVRRLNNYTGWCSNCSSNDPYIQLENYLQKHADHLEHYISKGFTVFQAIHLVRDDIRPSCLTCGEVIPHAPKNSIFCSRYNRCRTANNRYRYLLKKGMNKSSALAKVIDEFN